MIELKANRDRRIRNFHPWIFKDDIASISGNHEAGALLEVRDAGGGFVAQAFYNPKANIPARVIAWERGKIDLDFYRRLIRKALKKRRHMQNTNAKRILNAESDGLSGVIVDQFGDVLAVQMRNVGAEAHRGLILEALKKETQASAAFERSDTSERSKEGLAAQVGVLWGDVPSEVQFSEDDLQFFFKPFDAQKTGFYLDQRDNRRRIAALLKAGDRVLDVYSYTGGFSLYAARAGASALAIDKDPIALQTLERSAAKNGLEKRISVRLGDALEVLDQLVIEKKRFTHAIVDPPTLAKRKEEVLSAKRIFTIACKNVLKMLEPNGVLLVSTCAFHMKVDDLLEAVRLAGADANRRLEVLDITYQPADHPWILQVQETLYLKSLLLRAE
ncbi:MAG: class I SAM-dependent rRNA methyltransferase [Deinococcales bacterium]